MARGGFPWRWLFFFIFSVCAGIVAYDVINSKGFKASKTNKFLVDSGILLFLESVWQRIKFYGGTAFVWLETNVPIYYAKTCEVVGPYLTLFWQKLYALGVYIAEVTKPQRDWLYQKVPIVLEWLQEKWPIVWGVCRHYLGVVWSLLLHYGSIAWDFLVHYSLIAGTWLQENVFKGSLSIENLQATAVSVLTALQAYMTAFIEWLAQLISSSMSDPDDSAAAAAAAGKAGA
jgi:hypothetical protein